MYMDGSCMLNPVYRRRSFAHVMQNVEYKILHVCMGLGEEKSEPCKNAREIHRMFT